MTEKNTRDGIRILPIHHLVLAQFVATLMFDVEVKIELELVSAFSHKKIIFIQKSCIFSRETWSVLKNWLFNA